MAPTTTDRIQGLGSGVLGLIGLRTAVGTVTAESCATQKIVTQLGSSFEVPGLNLQN